MQAESSDRTHAVDHGPRPQHQRVDDEKDDDDKDDNDDKAFQEANEADTSFLLEAARAAAFSRANVLSPFKRARGNDEPCPIVLSSSSSESDSADLWCQAESQRRGRPRGR